MDNGMDELTQKQIDELRQAFRATQDKERALQEDRDRADQMDAMRYAFEQIEQREEAKRRAVIIGAGRRNGKDLDAQIVAAACAAGIDPTSEDFADLIRRVSEKLKEVAVAIHDMVDIVVAAINEAWQPMMDAWEEIQKLIEQCEYADEPEEPDRHDGAVKVLVTWLLPVPTIYELYGQGVDHGGPGPSRLTLTRVTDDGLRRAETGQIRKGEKHDDHFSEHSAGPDRLRAVPGHGLRKGRRPPEEHHPGLRGYPGGDRSDQFRGVTQMKKYKGYDLVEAADIDAAITWAKNIRAEDPEKEPEIKTLRDVLVTGLTYARVVAANMGGLPCFAEDQTPEERKKAMAAAAAMARRPDGGARKNRRKKGTT